MISNKELLEINGVTIGWGDEGTMKDTFLLDTLKILIGTLTGALVAILTMWLRERTERRRVINEWFENTFLFQSIEPLLHKARGIMTSINLDIEELPEVFDDTTRSQIQRINQLLRDDKFENLWAMASYHSKRKEEVKIALMLFHGLSVTLRDLQDAVLQTTITNRRKIFTLAGTARYKKVLEGLVEGDKIYQRLLEMAQIKQPPCSVDSEPVGDEYIP